MLKIRTNLYQISKSQCYESRTIMLLYITILTTSLAAAVHENGWKSETTTKKLTITDENIKNTEEQIRCVFCDN